MANLIATAQTLIQVGEAGTLPEVTKNFLSISPSTTMLKKGKQQLGIGTTVFNLGGIGNAVFVFLKFTVTSTGADTEVLLLLSRNTDDALQTNLQAMNKCTQFMFSGNDVTKGIQLISITATVATTVDFVIAGVV